jgi:hypothetical protein
MKLYLASLAMLFSAASLAHADLIAHYDFDTVETSGGVSTTDEVTTGGTHFATGGSRATFDQSRRRLGTGSLVLKSVAGTEVPGNDGAVSSNTFDWSSSDVRTIAFWMRAAVTQTDAQPTMISFRVATGTANFQRFDVRLDAGKLRVELQGGGFTATSASVLNDDKWHHVAVVVPVAVATLGNVKYYIDGAFIGTMTGTQAINTATSPLRMGDSLHDVSRDFTGALDDVRLYNEALDDAAILALYQNAQANGPQIIFFEPDLPVGPPGAARTLRYQLSTGVTTASINQGIGSVLPVDSIGYGTVAISPVTTTEYTLDTLRGAEASQAKTSIRVSSEPLVLDFVYGPQPGRARMFVFMPDPTKNYYLTRSADLADGFTSVVSQFLLPSVPYQEVIDITAPAGRAFYRLEPEDVPPP